MIKNKKIFTAVLLSFFAIELVLFFLVQLTSEKAWAICAYSSVVLACLFMLTSISLSKNYVYTQLALTFTICADWFLVVLDPIKELPAMIFFSFVQMCYFLRLYNNHETDKQRTVHLTCRLCISMLAILASFVILGSSADALTAVSLFYYGNLILNVIVAFTQTKKSVLLPIGLLLFLLCDTVVGLNAMTDYVFTQSANKIYNALFGTINWSWVFYLPSQVLIALSLTNFKFENEK